jgi:hypothetical protein
MSFCTPHISWWIALVVIATASIGMAMLLKLINIKEIIKELKQ